MQPRAGRTRNAVLWKLGQRVFGLERDGGWRDHAGARLRREGRCPEGEGRQKTRRSRSDEGNDREGDRNGEGEKRRELSRERASERRYNRGCWTRAGRVVAVAAVAVVGDDRETPWIRPHEEKKAAALLRGVGMDRGKRARERARWK